VSAASALAVLTSEWTKIRSVRSTVWSLALTFPVSVGLGYLVARSSSGFVGGVDPLFATFYGLTLSQLALVSYGVLLVGAEYSSGTIHATLAAVPRRGLLYTCKVLAGTLPALGVSAASVLVTFFTAQAAMGPRGTSLGSDGVLLATVGACLYLTLICVFSMGVAAMLRSSTRSLLILLPLLFLGSQGLGNIPKLRYVAQYLPDQAGMVIMHIAGQNDQFQGSHDYGPWVALGLLVLWAGAALLGGYLVLRQRDA